MIARTAAALWQRTYARYAMASIVALSTDIGMFLILLGSHLPPVLASMVSYTLGIIVHWLVSSRLVFHDSVAIISRERTRQKTLFLASALVGMAITSAIVAYATLRGLDPRVAKLCAVFVSFQTTYLLRRSIVFA